MKININTSLEAFKRLSKSTTNKFWGLICVFCAIEKAKQVESGITYTINTKKL